MFSYDRPGTKYARKKLGNNSPSLEKVFQHEKVHVLSIVFEINDLISSIKYDISDFNNLPKIERCVGNLCDDTAFSIENEINDSLVKIYRDEKEHGNIHLPPASEH